MARDLFLENESPVDFLYIDRNRVASLIGQLSDRGMLINLKQTVSRGSETQAAAGVKSLLEGRMTRSAADLSEETYDPFWSHAYSFLRDLQLNFASPLRGESRFGSIVVTSGSLQIVDLRMMKNLWEPSIKAAMLATQHNDEATARSSANRPPRSRRNPGPAAPLPEAVGGQQQTFVQFMSLVAEMLKHVPHLVHAAFLSESGFKLWAPLQPQFLTVNSEDLLMKYGAVIDGTWTVVGILDGFCIPRQPFPVSPLLDSVMTTTNQLREQIGRPEGFFGLTPIAIFQSLLGVSESEVAGSAE